MTKDELQAAYKKAELYYEQCVNEWSICQEELLNADADCESAEERMLELKAQLEKFDE